MSLTEMIFAAVSGLFSIIFFFIRQTIVDMKSDIHETQQAVNDVKLNYLHRDDFKEFKIELRSMFEELKRDLKDFKRDQENGRS
jgi:hypothetical protein